MGNRTPNLTPLTPENLTEAVKTVMNDMAAQFQENNLRSPLSVLVRYFKGENIFQRKENQLKVNKIYLSLVFSSYFSKQLLKLMKLLLVKLQEWNKKSINSIKMKDIELMYLLSSFILLMGNEKFLSTVDSLSVRSDLYPQTKQYISQQQGQEQIIGDFIEKMDGEEKQQAEKILRIALNSIINMKATTLGRSEETLKSIVMVEQSLFMLYMKFYFKKDQQVLKIAIKEHYKTNITIGAYFLSAGTSRIKPSIFETAVLFLYSIFKHLPKQTKEIKMLPSHLFTNLPVIVGKQIQDYILCVSLYTLKYVYQGKSVYIRFSFNRIMCLKMINEVLKNFKTENSLMIYYLEELCFQVQAGQIERAYLYEVLKTYIENNGMKSEFFKKFITKSNKNYNLKIQEKQIKVSTQELLTELEDDKNSFWKQFIASGEKYVHECILNQSIAYNYNDLMIWNEILPGIIHSKEDQKMKKQHSSDSPQEEEQVHENAPQPVLQ